MDWRNTACGDWLAHSHYHVPSHDVNSTNFQARLAYEGRKLETIHLNDCLHLCHHLAHFPFANPSHLGRGPSILDRERLLHLCLRISRHMLRDHNCLTLQDPKSDELVWRFQPRAKNCDPSIRLFPLRFHVKGLNQCILPHRWRYLRLWRLLLLCHYYRRSHPRRLPTDRIHVIVPLQYLHQARAS